MTDTYDHNMPKARIPGYATTQALQEVQLELMKNDLEITNLIEDAKKRSTLLMRFVFLHYVLIFFVLVKLFWGGS